MKAQAGKNASSHSNPYTPAKTSVGVRETQPKGPQLPTNVDSKSEIPAPSTALPRFDQDVHANWSKKG